MPTRDEWTLIHGWIADISKRSRRMYLGRTNAPERRLLQHRVEKGLNKLFSLYWTDTPSEIAYVEKTLLARYGNRNKLENIAEDARGAWGRGPHAVYISWVWKRDFGDHNVGTLTPTLVNAVPERPRRSRYLYSPLTKSVAQEQLALAGY